MGDNSTRTSLRAQVQPFQTYTPQQIQQQLQHLHIQQHNESESVIPTVVPGVAAVPQQQNQHHQNFHTVEEQSLQSCREASPTKESSMLHHLLSQTPKPGNITQNSLFSPQQSHRASFPDNMPGPFMASKLRQPSPVKDPSLDLSAMMGNIAPHDFPSFPVNIQNREGSPTKGLGRRSPNHDHQMASIAEDTSEEIAGLSTGPFVASSAGSIAAHLLSNGMDNQEDGHCTVPGITTGTPLDLHASHSTEPQLLMQMCNSSGNQGTLGYHNFPPQQRSNSIMQDTLNHPPSSLGILNRISTVLNSSGIQHYQSSGGFIVEHNDVKLHIMCNPSHFNTIRMQYIAGNPVQYETLSSHLARQLQFTE